jgi:uncharacterized membrane protein
MLIAAWARHFFNLRHRGIVKPSILLSALLAFAALAWVMTPKPTTPSASSAIMPDAQAIALIQEKCTACHSVQPSDDVFKTAPAGVMYDTQEQIYNWLPRIQARVIVSKDMPFMNKTQMSDEQRQALAVWLDHKLKPQ